MSHSCLIFFRTLVGWSSASAKIRKRFVSFGRYESHSRREKRLGVPCPSDFAQGLFGIPKVTHEIPGNKKSFPKGDDLFERNNRPLHPVEVCCSNDKEGLPARCFIIGGLQSFGGATGNKAFPNDSVCSPGSRCTEKTPGDLHSERGWFVACWEGKRLPFSGFDISLTLENRLNIQQNPYKLLENHQWNPRREDYCETQENHPRTRP